MKRFIEAQEGMYPRALAELKAGRKQSHWMWFIFPQIAGLGISETSRFYAIRDLQEAMQYLDHPLLGKRLEECCQALLLLEGLSVLHIFGSPDDLKLKSSMTLFSQAADEPEIFERVLDRYYSGEKDERTLDILARLNRQV